MNPRFSAGLSAALDAVEARAADLSALVIHGAGAHFCTGMDLSYAESARAAGGLLPGAAAALALSRCVARISRLPVAVLAVAHGAVTGGGVALALHADWRVAAEDATFWWAGQAGLENAQETTSKGLGECGWGQSP
jgi:enoyl-CoA hydratase/carnithine racemase